MYARVEWWDAKGGHHVDGIDRPIDLSAVMALVEARGGTISKFNRVPATD